MTAMFTCGISNPKAKEAALAGRLFVSNVLDATLMERSGLP
jgi:hypothetical protein